MSDQLRQRLFAELDSIRLIDPHSHIEPKTAASKTLADILGYHYYTELMPLGRHAAGPRSKSRASTPRKKSAGWSRGSSRCGTRFNTVGCWSWPATFFDFPAGEHLTPANWETLYDTAAKKMAQPNWEQQVLDRTKLDAVFLTNNFDDPLDRLRHEALHPLPADGRPGLPPRQSRKSASGWKRRRTPTSATPHRCARQSASCSSILSSKGARACAISLPPVVRAAHDVTPHAADKAHCTDRRRTRRRPDYKTPQRSPTSSSGRSPNSAPSSSCRSI